MKDEILYIPRKKYEDLLTLTIRAVEHILDYDYDYIACNYNSWDDYLKCTFCISYYDFVNLTGHTLQDLWVSD